MNNYSEGRRFIRLLEAADTLDMDMSPEDWCQACGFLKDYGHGYLFDLPESDSAIIRAIEQTAASIM